MDYYILDQQYHVSVVKADMMSTKLATGEVYDSQFPNLLLITENACTPHLGSHVLP